MIDRGGCTFVKKVRNAQKAGAAAVLIADTKCVCGDNDCTNLLDEDESCELKAPFLGDDGSGADVSIPSFLVLKQDADIIKEELKSNQPVQIEMAWSMPSPDARVEYELYSTPADPQTEMFLKEFKPIAEALGDRAYFTPHYYLYGCPGGGDRCRDMCTNSYRYCISGREYGISGAGAVQETLRQLCIWKYYGAEDGIGSVWWDYVGNFRSHCIPSDYDYKTHEDCTKKVYKLSNVDAGVIDQCISNSGGVDKDAPNVFLDQELEYQLRRGYLVNHAAVVNGAVVHGSLNAGNVFRAICAGFVEGSTPKICQQCFGCAGVAGCVESGGQCSSGQIMVTPNSKQAVSKHTFVIFMVLTIGILGSVGAWYRKKTRADMRDEVRGILAEYMPLEDNETPYPMESKGTLAA